MLILKFCFYICTALGEMAEWSNAVVLKTIVLKGTGGSNPSLSAFIINKPDLQVIVKSGFFLPVIFNNFSERAQN